MSEQAMTDNEAWAEAERLLGIVEARRETARRATADWYYNVGSRQAMCDADDEVERAQEAFYDFASDNGLCGCCGKRVPRMLAWPFVDCPEHTEPDWIATDVLEHGFDFDAWCDMAQESKDQGWVKDAFALIAHRRDREEKFAETTEGNGCPIG